MRVGIDVGGTNTDAVLMDERRVVTWHKTATTADVSSGIIAALRVAPSERDPIVSGEVNDPPGRLR